jgi:hypothetical protein
MKALWFLPLDLDAQGLGIVSKKEESGRADGNSWLPILRMPFLQVLADGFEVRCGAGSPTDAHSMSAAFVPSVYSFLLRQ